MFEHASLTTHGWLSVSGWPAAEAGIVSVECFLDEVPVGTAELGPKRPDVGRDYPEIAGADRAGFRLRQHLGRQFSGRSRLGVLVNGVGTDGVWTELEVEAVDGPPLAADGRAGSGEEEDSRQAREPGGGRRRRPR